MRARREQSSSQSERLAIYLDRLSQVAGHADRIVPMQNYTKGLFFPLSVKVSSRWRRAWPRGMCGRCIGEWLLLSGEDVLHRSPSHLQVTG
jgi:SRSO17 transposase